MSGLIANASFGTRLEDYTLRFSDEVLLIQAVIEGEADTVIVFKGFSSSLMRPTPEDPEVPIIPEGTEILSIARLRGPYIADSPQYIERNMSLGAFTERMVENNI